MNEDIYNKYYNNITSIAPDFGKILQEQIEIIQKDMYYKGLKIDPNYWTMTDKCVMCNASLHEDYLCLKCELTLD